MVISASGIGDRYITTKKVFGYNYGENIVLPKGTVLILEQGDQYVLEFKTLDRRLVILHRDWIKDAGYSNYFRLPEGVKLLK